MSDHFRRALHSKRLFVTNLVLLGAVGGLVVAGALFLGTGHEVPFQPVRAQESRGALVDLGGPETASDAGVIPASFHDVAAKVLPSVVEINVVDIVKQTAPSLGQGFPWDFFFQQGPGQGQTAPQTQEFRQEALGSGVIVQRSGDTYYVLTNNHVVGTASEIKVTLNDKRDFTAKLVGKDARMDLALVSFKSGDQGIPVATLGDSDSLQVGDWVLAVGNPFGFMSTVTAGIVSAKGREGEGPSASVAQFIQTDAAINQGNSGGALVNLNGQVVGINSWIASPAGGSVGLGFAIAINDAKRAITDFIDHGSIQYGWLGASVEDPPAALADQLKIAGMQGSMIAHVFVNSPADKGGLLPGDYVTRINGNVVADTNELLRDVGNLPAGQDATFQLIRYGQPQTATVRVELRQSEQKIDSNRDLWPGFDVAPINDQMRSELNLGSDAKGLIVTDVIGKTSAAVAGIQQGDIVLGINRVSISNAIDFYRAVNAAGKNFTFELSRQGSTISIGLQR